MFKDATTGYVSIQTVCSVLRADLYRAWTYLYMFWAGSEGTVGIWRRSVHYTTLGAVCHDNQARLGRLTVLGDSWLGGYACGSVFRAGHPGLL